MNSVTLACGMQVKLGRRRPQAVQHYGRFTVVTTEDGRKIAMPRLGIHYDAAKDTAPPPDSVDWSTKADASINRVYLNDQEGDCVIAGKYHAVGVWTGADTGTPALGTDQEVNNSYHTICGPSDNGCNIVDVLEYFKNTGLPFNGVRHKILGYASVDWTNANLVKVCIDVFGGLTLGINLPQAWTCAPCTWDVTNSGIVGGHDVRAFGYDSEGVWIATWGKKVKITWKAFTSRSWLEEVYVELSEDWTGSDKLAPNGIDAATLMADLQLVSNGQVPPINPGPITPPDPKPPQTFIVHIPMQPVIRSSWFDAGHIAAFDVQGSLDHNKTAQLGPVVSRLLRLLCAAAPLVPPPYNAALTLLCGLLPHANATTAVTVPPWVLPVLLRLAHELCKLGPDLPAPYNSYAQLLCSLLPPAADAKSPCNCK